MTNPTPGPWFARGVEVLTRNEQEVCRCPVKTVEGFEEAAANALLLAQAPALRDLCERLLGVVLHHAHPSALWAASSLLDEARETLEKTKSPESPQKS